MDGYRASYNPTYAKLAASSSDDLASEIIDLRAERTFWRVVAIAIAVIFIATKFG